MDHIHVRDLACRTILGDNPQERRARQDVLIQLRLGYEGLAAGRSDRLADALDYRAVKKRVVAHVEGSSFRLVEALAESIADLCLAEPRVREVTVTVDKPGALRFARSVAIEVTRVATTHARSQITQRPRRTTPARPEASAPSATRAAPRPPARMRRRPRTRSRAFARGG